MSKKTLVGAFVLLIIIVVVVVGLMSFDRKSGSEARSPYTAVYMASGDIYFGKLSWFPRPKLTSVWYLQRSVNAQNQTELSVAPFTGVFWGPNDAISLNPDQIVFSARLRADSQLAKAIADPSSVTVPQGPAQDLQSQTPQGGSTTGGSSR